VGPEGWEIDRGSQGRCVRENKADGRKGAAQIRTQNKQTNN
jgi:hypothetical protein